jgi:hypothetical protein
MQCSFKIAIVSEVALQTSGTATKYDHSPLPIPIYLERSPYAAFPEQVFLGTKWVPKLFEPSYRTLSLELPADGHPIEHACPH